MEKLLYKFEFNSGENDNFKLVDDPTRKEVINAKNALLTMLRKSDPNSRTFIVYIFACHGINYASKQVILLNEFEKKRGFYAIFNAEENIRTMAEDYSNSAHFAIFACCREAWDDKKHSGCVPGPLTNAIE